MQLKKKFERYAAVATCQFLHVSYLIKTFFCFLDIHLAACMHFQFWSAFSVVCNIFIPGWIKYGWNLWKERHCVSTRYCISFFSLTGSEAACAYPSHLSSTSGDACRKTKDTHFCLLTSNGIKCWFICQKTKVDRRNRISVSACVVRYLICPVSVIFCAYNMCILRFLFACSVSIEMLLFLSFPPFCPLGFFHFSPIRTCK